MYQQKSNLSTNNPESGVKTFISAFEQIYLGSLLWSGYSYYRLYNHLGTDTLMLAVAVAIVAAV
jgi:hypothetical protein